ncbi:early nodulin-55-1-like [Impatiens glandulifera]|uniref:early nodulin-55-1-like n=1 Tax=Impatiens glandulifera TaxID=253017 RepID=UPI001FB19F84|nr:early nodulin-55-1-like [Impatiens glandulifera]
MDSPLWVIISMVLVVVVVVDVAEASMEFKVGGLEGWRQPFENETAIYIQWASNNRFHVGDSLRFEYNNNKNKDSYSDSVIVVDKYCFYHCNSSSCTAAVVYEDGNTTIRLEKTGPAYFISGNITHCKQGQRLVIQVMSSSSIYDSPPSIALPPDSSSSSSSSNTNTAAAAAPSPASSTSFALPMPLLMITAATAASYLFAATATTTTITI